MAERPAEHSKTLDDVVKKGFLTLLGAWLLVHEKADDLIRASIAKSSDKSDANRDFIDELTVRADEEKENLNRRLRDSLAEAIGAPSRSEIEEIGKRLAEIEERLSNLEKASERRSNP